MSEDKKSWRQKYNNKQKFKKQYKPKNVTETQPKKESGPVLEKNWDRYEEPEEDQLDKIYSFNRDFKALSEHPISQGGYFQFKKDKIHFPADDIKPQIDSIFELDINLINLSLCSLPFYERLGIDRTAFHDDEIESMEENAVENNKKLLHYLDKLKDEKLNMKSTEQIRNTNDKMMTELIPQVETIHIERTEETKELEAWLDDILE